MTQQWRIRISGQPKPKPDIALLVAAVFALADQLEREREQREVNDRDDPPKSSGDAA